MQTSFERALRVARHHQRLIGVALFIGALVAVFEMSGLRGHFDLPYLRALILQHRAGGLVLFVLLFCLGNLVHIPGWIFLAAAVLALGRTWGGAVTYAAAVVSCMLTFITIRWLGGDALRGFENRIAARILGELDSHPVRSVVLLRMLFQTVPTLNYALALSGIRLRNYVLGTLVGLPVPIALYCIFFDILAAHLGVR